MQNTSTKLSSYLKARSWKLEASFGFSLIELIIGMAISTTLVVIILTILSSLISGNNKQLTIIGSTDQARRAGYAFTSQLRNAVYASTGAYPIASAGAQEIIFYSDVDGGTDVERLRYFLQGTDLKRGLVKPSGSPLAYNLASEEVTTVARYVANGASPVFYYYNGSYEGVTDVPLAQPVSITAVKHVAINLRITNQAGTGINTFTVRSQATPRIAKENLGD